VFGEHVGDLPAPDLRFLACARQQLPCIRRMEPAGQGGTGRSGISHRMWPSRFIFTLPNQNALSHFLTQELKA
jgi:hypothetical protein